jgi:hypothetical protein
VANIYICGGNIVRKYALTIGWRLACFKLRGSHGLVCHNTVFCDTLSFDRQELQSFAGIFKPAAFLRLHCRRINKLEASEVHNTCSVFVVIFCGSLCNFSDVNERNKRNNVGNCGNKMEYSVCVT